MNDTKITKINENEYEAYADNGNIRLRYLTKDHKAAHSINDQYVEIYSKSTQKTLVMPLKELQEGLKSQDYGLNLVHTLLKSTFKQSNKPKTELKQGFKQN
ncbi:MAG: hypothetical protein LBF36_00040 [Mycoplasmataceae bacterium]|jgi:hypothetical protein|nr:hypothetical protein [Mycoplasmataceae bacterium]